MEKKREWIFFLFERALAVFCPRLFFLEKKTFIERKEEIEN